jgi:tRNA threonylcarbamoyladenosine biosynthesis protein TsaE
VSTVTTQSAQETDAAGRRLAKSLAAGDLILLIGDLAAGKTTFVRGVVAGLGGDPDDVSSPTFVLLQSYPMRPDRGVRMLHHLDLYRLEGTIRDLREIGVDEVLNDPSAVIAVEWPKDALATWVPADARTWTVRIDILDDGSRRLELTPPRGDRSSTD